MQLEPAAFNEFLGNIGQSLSLRRATECPCVSPVTGGTDQSCPHCGGKGYAWGSAITGVAAPAGQKIQRQWAELGRWEPGDIVVTIPADSPVYAMGLHDRAVMLNQSEPFSTTRVHGGETLDFPVVAIESVYWLNVSKVPVTGGVPTVNSNGTLTWSAGEPPSGATYSITGRRRPEFFCFQELPQDRPVHFGAALPRRVVLRRFDLWGR